MMLEAVWFRSNKEIYKVSPVMCVACSDDIKDISEIEIEDEENNWHYREDADDFVIRIKRD